MLLELIKWKIEGFIDSLVLIFHNYYCVISLDCRPPSLICTLQVLPRPLSAYQLFQASTVCKQWLLLEMRLPTQRFSTSPYPKQTTPVLLTLGTMALQSIAGMPLLSLVESERGHSDASFWVMMNNLNLVGSLHTIPSI